MSNLELQCKDLISYLGDSIDENQIEHIKNVFVNIGKDTCDSIYPQFKRIGDREISEGGLSKLDYFAAKLYGTIYPDMINRGYNSKDSTREVFEKAAQMVEESNKRQS